MLALYHCCYPTDYRESLKKESRVLKKQLREAKRLKEKVAKEKEEGEQGKASLSKFVPP